MNVKPVKYSFNIVSENLIHFSFKYAIDKILTPQKNLFLARSFVNDLQLAFTEAVANAIRHAKEIDHKGQVDCEIKISSSAIEIKVFDHGKGFNLDNIQTPKFKSYAESGRGIFMIRQLVDHVQYKTTKSHNVLTLTRNLIGTDKSLRELDLLYEISQAMLEDLEPQIVYQILLNKALDVFEAEKASILIFNPASKRLELAASKGLNTQKGIQIRPGEGIAGYVFQHAKPCLIEDMEKNQSGWKRKKKYKSLSFISAPLIRSLMKEEESAIGVINITDRKDGQSFSKQDLKLLTTLANQAAAYIHIGTLFTQAKKSEFINRELRIAHQIQQSYLPQKPPQIKGIELAGWLQTAESVGGDYYDFILRDKKNLYIVVADVSGHNIGAALAMANLRSQLKGLLINESNPGKILTELNKRLYDDLARNDQFVSIILVQLSLISKKIEVASAGHRGPLVVHKNSINDFFDYRKAGGVLGAIENEKYSSIVYRLKKFDLLFLYTDGLTEMMNLKGKRLGKEYLINFLTRKSRLTPSSLIKSLQKEINVLKDSSSFSDDMTTVAIRIG